MVLNKLFVGGSKIRPDVGAKVEVAAEIRIENTREGNSASISKVWEKMIIQIIMLFRYGVNNYLTTVVDPNSLRRP